MGTVRERGFLPQFTKLLDFYRSVNQDSDEIKKKKLGAEWTSTKIINTGLCLFLPSHVTEHKLTL